MKKVVPFFLFMAVMLFNTFMVHSLKHDRLPFLSTKSVEAMAWEEMNNPNWLAMRLVIVDCLCLSNSLVGETIQCSYLAPSQNENCSEYQQGFDRCYDYGHIGTVPLNCASFIWLSLDGEWYIHP